MTRVVVAIRLAPELVAKIDARVLVASRKRRSPLTRSDVIRELLDHALSDGARVR